MSVKLVRDLMRIGVNTCPAGTPLAEAVRLLLRDGLESLVVLDDRGHAVGLFGRREAVAGYARMGIGAGEGEALTVADVMRPNIPQVPPDTAPLMLDQAVREFYLLHHDGGASWPSAVFRFDDVLRDLAAESEAEVAAMGAGAARKSPIERFRERYPRGGGAPTSPPGSAVGGEGESKVA